MRGTGQARPVTALAAVLVVVAALALVATAARSGRTATVRPITTASPTPAPPTARRAGATPVIEQSPAANTPPDPPLEFGVLVMIVMAGVLVLLALFLWIVVERVKMRTGTARRRRSVPGRLVPPAASVPVHPAVLAAAVEAGLRELENGEPGEGVIACWVQLERAAAEAGAGRAAPETPSELAGRLIDTRGVEAGALVGLAELYREARYSTHPVGEDARTRARSLLEEVRADLALASAGLAVRTGRVRR